MSAGIAGIGVWLPERVRRNDAWPEAFVQRAHASGDRTFNDIPPAIDERAAAIVARDLAREASDPFLGAVERRVADEALRSADAEALAARDALRDAGLDAADVDLVLSNSVVPDKVYPPTAPVVAHAIGARRALALGVDAACASSIPQLEIARAYVDSGLARVVLLTQSHLMLRTFPLEHPACPGLGDCATALVVTRDGPLALRATYAVTHGEFDRAVLWIRGTTDETDVAWWKAGPDYRLGSRAPEQAKQLMRDTVAFGADTVRHAAERAGVDVERIGVLASVQPRGFIPGAIAEHLGLPRERAVTSYEDIAHVGVCGPVFNLHRARALGLLTPGALAALYGQGAGFTRAAAVIEVR